jgi:hypothetical protein
MGNRTERGLMSVPHSFPADQYGFLVKLLAYVQRLGGNIRGDNRAVRHSEMGAFAGREAVIRDGGVAARQLADGSVTSEKLADNAVTGQKIAQGSITGREIRSGAVNAAGLASGSVSEDKIAAGAVTGDKIADASVGASKLTPGIAVSFVRGEASDGETVTVPGTWLAPPMIALTSITIPEGFAEGRLGALDLREGDVPGTWEFDAAGDFAWFAVGYAGERTHVEG